MKTPAGNVPLNDPRMINGWAIFDWANSAFALVITVAVFPAYYLHVTPDIVPVFGIDVENSALYAFAISAAYLVLALVSPLLSGIADYSGRKKFFMKFFTTVGSLGCITLFFYRENSPVSLGTVAFMLGIIGFAGALVFYNAFLPQIASEDKYDQVSARGYAYGYVGSVLLLIINLVIITFPTAFGLSEDGDLAVRLAFLMVGLWWFGFAQIPFSRLPADDRIQSEPGIISKGYQELKKVFRDAARRPNLIRFLAAFFCYSAGVQTVLFMASTFAEVELQFNTQDLIILVLILQIVAVGGAFLFAWVSGQRGNKFSLIVMLIIWTAICFTAYFLTNKFQFYLLGGAVGMVMGGIQALSRSTYSKLIPENTPDTASYFSFYDVLEKVAIILGTFIFGFAQVITGDIKYSILALGVFFVVSILILFGVKIKHTRPDKS